MRIIEAEEMEEWYCDEGIPCLDGQFPYEWTILRHCNKWLHCVINLFRIPHRPLLGDR